MQMLIILIQAPRVKIQYNDYILQLDFKDHCGVCLFINK